MPFRLTTFPDARIGLAVVSGHATGADLADAFLTLLGMDDWASGFDQVWDLAETTDVDVTPSHLTHIVATIRKHADQLGEGRVACVTPRNALVVLVRLVETLTLGMGRHFKTFQTRAEAAEWLGLDADVLEDAGIDRSA